MTSTTIDSTGAIPVAQQDEKWVLLATILPASMGFISTSGLDAASPAIQEALGINGTTLFWIINIYALFLSALILVGGSLGDHMGRKRIYMGGIALFSAASLACGLAPDSGALILFRAIQGIGAALMVPGSLAILTALITPDRRGRAIGWWSTFSAVTSILGAPLGGWLASEGLWRGVFFVNIPLGLLALYVLSTRVPESYDEGAAKQLDYMGALLATLGLAGLSYGFLQGAEFGFSDGRVLVALAAGVVGFIAFIMWEARTDHPMMPLDLFRSPTFSGANLLTFFLYAALRFVPFFLVLNLVQVQGYPMEIAGLTLLPLGLTLTFMGRWAGGLVDRIGARTPLIIGPVLTGVGFAAMALPGMTNGAADYWVTYFPGIMVMSIGMAIMVAPLTTTVMNAVPAAQSGTASGINNAVSRTGGVLAMAVMGAVAIIVFQSALTTRLDGISTLPEDARTILIEEEAGELAAAQAPDSLDAETAATAQDAINNAFIDTFRLVALVGAAMCWVSALMTVLLIRDVAKDEEAASAHIVYTDHRSCGICVEHEAVEGADMAEPKPAA